MNQRNFDFDGDSYDRDRDGPRLNSAIRRVFALMKDEQPHTLQEIAEYADCSEAGASARFRDFRKPRFKRFFKVESANSECVDGGLWVYWLTLKK